jgi:hypothetical protein
MKVKLLKKIRKRYSITHYPNGAFMWDDFYEGPITLLEDKNSSFRLEISHSTKPEAYDRLYKIMLEWIERDYGPFRSKRIKITSEQLWYKK